MIRVDRNLQENLSILPDPLLSQFLRPASTDRSSSLSPVPDSNSPHTQPEAPASSPLPPAAEEREEPVKVPQREEEEEEEARVEKSSRLSTPLSELSPAPDDLDLITDPDPTTATEEQKNGATLKRSGSQASTSSESAPQGLHTSPFADKRPPDGLNGSAASAAQSPPKTGGYKIIAILELNAELFRLCMEFQKKGIPPTDTLYYQFSQRLQSNLGWLAGIADSNRSPTSNNASLPIMEPPPIVDFFSCERIQQIYAELPRFFAKDIARQQQLGIPFNIPGSGIPHSLNPSQKRERTDDVLPDHANKRQNTGETKLSPSQMMPPPSSIPSTATSTPASHTSLLPGTATQPAANSFSLSMSNGHSPPSTSPQHFVRLSPDGNAQPGVAQQSMLNPPETQMATATRARQAHMRVPQQQQQQAAANPKNMPANMPGPQNMNPPGAPMNMNPGVGAGTGQGMSNVITSHPQITAQQVLQIMQNPSHPIMQHLVRSVPGFQSLPHQAQMQKIAFIIMQNRNQQSEQQQRAAAPVGMQNVQQGMSIQNNAGGMSLPMANANPAHFAAMGMGQQNNVFSAGIQSSNPGGVGGHGGMSAVNMNNLNSQQRHLLLMQQQHQRGAANMALGNSSVNAVVGAGANGSAGMNAQQIALSQQPPQQQQQRMTGGISVGAGVGMGSPMLGGSNDFQVGMRANNSIPGIARSARSPTDSSSNPMTQRAGRGTSMGPEDYQRMLMKQQQGHNPQAAAMFGSPGSGGAAQAMVGGNWGGPGHQGGMGMGGQGQMQSPQLQGIQNMQNMQSMQGMQGMHGMQGMQGMQMQGGYAMSSPTQPQQQPQQHQQAQSAAVGSAGLGGGVGSPFLGGSLSSSPPPMGVSSPTWGGSPTQHQHPHQTHQVQTQHGAAMSTGMSASIGGGMGNMFSPFSSTDGLGDLSGHMSTHSQTSQDDFGGLFDWTPS